MLVESTKIRNLLNQSTELLTSKFKPGHYIRGSMDTSEDEERVTATAPATYAFSTNPMPALTIILLGIRICVVF